MRNLILILTLMGVYMTSCKEDDENPFGFTGNATGQKNGQGWNSNVRVTKNLPYEIGLDITFTVLNGEGFQREHLSIVRVKTSTEVQRIYLTLLDNQIKNDSVAVLYTTLIDDGDVVGDVYGIDTTFNDNYVQLTRIDSKKCEIAGVFNLRLKLIKDDNEGPTPPDFLEFSDGEFISKVEKEWIE
jgi:hypothetical protein